MAWTPPSDAVEARAQTATTGGWNPPGDALEVRPPKASVEDLGSPMGDDMGAAIMAASDKPKSERRVYTGSVFDTQPFEPEFNPEEAARLSRRDYAEKGAEQPRRTQSMRATPADQIERSVGRAIADTGIGLLQGAAGIPKGIAANINAGDNPIAKFYEEAIQAGERSKSPYLQSQKAEREALLKNVLSNQGELAQTRAAFTSMFSPSGADVIAQGAGSMLPTVGMSLLNLGQKSFVAMNALANAGDAAQNTAQELAQMSPQDWSKSDAYQELRGAGLSHRDAVKMLAPLMAMPSQLTGGVVGGISGATGLEKTLAGKAIKGGAKERAARAGAELLGEEAETLAPSLAGNITQRMIDEKKSITEGLGREAVETAFGSTPGMALAASGRSRPEAPKELDTRGLAEQMMRERGFLTPEARTERPAEEKPQVIAERPVTEKERVEPTFDEEAFTPSAPRSEDDLTKQRAQEQSDVIDLETGAEPKAPEKFSYVEEAAKYDTPEMRLKQAEAFGEDVTGLIFGETESHGRAALKKRSLTAGYAAKMDSRNDASDAANVAFGTGDYSVFTPYEKLFPRTAAKLKAALTPKQEVAVPETPSEQPAVVQEKEDYASKSLEELQALRDSADQTNNELDLASVKKHFGPEVAATYEGMNRRQRDKWWSENATEDLDRDASTFKGVDEELIGEYIKAYNDFDTESPRTLGKSVGLLARKIKDPGFVGSPDFVRLKNALAYAKERGWSESEVLGGMRERASEWAGADAQELFKDLFKPKAAPSAAPGKAPSITGEGLANEPAQPEARELPVRKEDDELDKRKAQLDREEELNQREARLLEERKRLEQERIKLEAPTKEAAAGKPEPKGEDVGQETTGEVPSQPAAEPEPVEVSTEEERKKAVGQLKKSLSILIPPFRSRGGDNKVSIIKPTPLSRPLLSEILKLVDDALDLGLPPAVLGNVKAAGATRTKSIAMMSNTGWLMTGRQWNNTSQPEKLLAVIHELGHAVDYSGGVISDKPNWNKAHTELQDWYRTSTDKFKHPVAYPFAPQYKSKVRIKAESFAQAFGYYFTSPVDLQKNAPEAYSQIQSIIERIQNESQAARAAGTTTAGTAGVKIQPTRTAQSSAVQPEAGEQRTDVVADAGLEDRGTGEVTDINAAIAGKNIFGQRPMANWTMPDSTNLDSFIYSIQNKQIDMKRAVDAIKESIGKIDERFDPYAKETLFAGRTATQTKRFLQNELEPLFKEMGRLGVTMPELEEYLHNRHAQERNEQIASVNEGMPDKGSGIETADAQDYLANLTPEQEKKYKKLASMVDAITAGTRQLLVDSGLESQETIDKWEETYENYIPLNRDDIDYSSNHGMGVGQGYSVRGSASKRAVGSERKVVDILANIAMQRERNIVRAEKNRVAMALYGMAIQNPNPDFFLAVNPDAKKDIPAATQELVNMGFLPSDIENLMDEPSTMEIDPSTGLAIERIHQMQRGADNVMGLRVNGENRYVFFNQNNERAKRMASAIKNLDADQLGVIMSTMADATRFLAAMNTQYNPIFGAYNFLRDISTAGLQLTNTPLAGKQAEVLSPKNVYGAMRGIYTDLRAERKGKAGASEWSKLWEDFQQRGGQTGFRDQFSSTAKRGEALQRIVDPSSWADSGLGKVFTAGGALKVPAEVARKAAAPLFNWLSDYNETMENAIRLSAYKAGLDSGMSKDAAAVMAKELTVNFNRKGQVATQAGALYAFFNASVQGTTALAKTLSGPAGKKIIAGGLMLGGIQAVLYSMAGFDEGEPPDFIREKNFVMPIGNGKYVAIPLPLGYNVIPNTSRLLTEAAIRAIEGKKVKPTETVFKIFESLLGAFNPIGNAGWSFQTLAPTVTDPIVALMENRDWTGKKIAREDFNSLDPTPGFTRYKEASSTFSRALAEFMNSMSGGTKDAPGRISPTPDQIDYFIGQITGGVGREALKIERAARSAVTGEELPPHAIPLAGRFYGDTKGSSAVSNAFYENLKEMNIHENTVKGMRKRKENVQEYFRENPEARMFEEAGRVEREVQALRKRRRELVEKEAPKESVRAIEARITARMTRFNEKIKQREEKKK